MSQNLMAGRVSPHSTASRVFKWKKRYSCDWFFRVIGFSVLCIKLCISGVSNSRPAAYFGPPHHFMWPARAYDCLTKTKQPMLLYIIHYESAYQYHKFLFLFGVLFIRRNWLWCAYDTQWFVHWWWLRGRLKGIKLCHQVLEHHRWKTRYSPFI